MSWLSRNDFTPEDKLHADDLNNLANDQQTWGGNVNGGGYTLSNVVLVGVQTAGAGAVSSVFGRVGDVVAQPTDYTPAFIGAVPTARQVIAGPGLSGGGPLSADVTLAALVTSVFGRTGAVTLTGADMAAAGGVQQTRQILAGTGLTGGGNLSADRTFSIVPDSVNQQVQVLSGASLISTRHAINFINGANVTVGIVDNTANNRTDITISSTGGSGGMVDPTTTLGDLIVRGSAAPSRLAVGANGQVLTADSTQPLGIKWAAAAGGGAVTTVFGRAGAVVAATGDYAAAQVTNAVDSTQTYANPAWLSSLAWAKITNPPAFISDPTTNKGDLIARGSSVLNRVSIGADGTVLLADSTQATGMRWGAATTASQTPWGSDIDAANHSLSNVKTLAVGSATSANNPLLTATLSSTDVGSATSISCVRFQDSKNQVVFGCSASYNVSGGTPAGGPWIQGQMVSGAATALILQPAGAAAPGGVMNGMGVGVGVLSPVYSLDVLGDINITGAYRIKGTPISTGGSGGSQTPWTSNIDAANYALTNCNRIGVGGATVGNAGLIIYDVVPAIYLQGSSSAAAAEVHFFVGSGIHWEIGAYGGSTAKFKIRDDAASADRFVIDQNGLVGINTTPGGGYGLSVSGTINCSGYYLNGAALGGVASVFGRTGTISAASGDYAAAQVTNAVDTTQRYNDPNWITGLSWSKITGAPTTGVASVFGRTGAVAAQTGDYNVNQITNAVSTTRQILTGTGLSGGGNLSGDITLAVQPDTVNQQVQALSAGVNVGTRHALNFIAGANVSLSVSDNPTNNRIDITVASTGGAGGMVDPTTNLGDLIVRGTNAVQRLAIGSNGEVLTLDSSQPLGMKWAAPSGGSGSQTPWTSDIDAANHQLLNLHSLGIGTGAPASQMHILAASGNDSAITLEAPTGNPYIVLLQGSQKWWMGVGVGGGSDWTVTNSTMGALITAKTSGRVGIFNTSPAYELDVGGGVNCSGGFFVNGVAIPTSIPAAPVPSVFGRTGAVVAATGDYTAAQVTNALSSAGSYSDPSWLTTLSWSKIIGAPAAPVASVFGRTGVVTAQAGDYAAAQVTNAVSTIGTYADPAWITALAWSKVTGAPALFTDPLTTKGDLMARSASASTRLGVGTDGQILTADSTAAVGMSWKPAPSGGSGGGSQTPWTSDIDAAFHNLSNLTALTVGSQSVPGSNYGITIYGPSNFDVGLMMFATADDNGAQIQLWNTGSGQFWCGCNGTTEPGEPNSAFIYSGADMLIYAGNSEPEAVRVIGANGFVGIGLSGSHPQYMLDVAGDINTKGVFRINGVPISTGGNVSSVFGRTGAVTATTGDYTAAQVTNAVSSAGSYADPSWLTALNWSKITGAPAIFADPTTTKGDLMVRGSSAPATRLGVGTNNWVLTADSTQTLGVKWAAAPVATVFGRSGAVVAAAGDYTASLVTNAVDSTQTYNNPAWITALAWSKVTGAPTFIQNPWTANVAAGGFALTNVGSEVIGSTAVGSPACSLEVQNATGINVMRVRGTTTSTNTSAIRFYGAKAATDTWAMGCDLLGSGVTDLHFYSFALSAVMFSVTATGLGVGTATPGCVIDSTGTIRSTGASSPASGAGIEMGYSAGSNYGFLAAYDHTNSLTKLLALNPSGGFVGVAKVNPAYAFDVAGDVNVTGAFRVNGAAVSMTGGGFSSANYQTVLATAYSGTALTNSTSLVDLLASCAVSGSLTIPASTMAAGMTLHLTVQGQFGQATSGTVPGITVTVQIGSTNVGVCTWASGSGAATTSRTGRFTLEVYITATSSSAVAVTGVMRIGGDGTTNATVQNATTLSATPSWGSAQALHLNAQWTATNASATIRVDFAQLTVINPAASPAPPPSQTPWTSDIDAGNHNLNNLTGLGIGSTISGAPYPVYINGSNGSGWPTMMVSNGVSTSACAMQLQNDQGNSVILQMAGSAYSGNAAWQNACALWTGSNLPIIFAINAVEGMRLNSTGLGISNTNPLYKLHLNVDSAAKPTTNTWTIPSDGRLKRNIRDLVGGLDIIKRLRPIEAEYNGLDGLPEGGRIVSFLAEEIRELLPGTVSSHRGKLTHDAEETDILDFNLHEVLIHLVLAVKQLEKRLKAVEPQVS